jgi:sec-independent protein translocase protein TatB
MFNIGFAEFLIIAVLALVILGPDQLPSAIRSLAKFIRNIRKTTSQLKEQIDPEFDSVTRDLRDAIEGDIDPAHQFKTTNKRTPHLNKAEKPPAIIKSEEAISVQAPSEDEGRPLARGAAYQPEAPALPAVSPEPSEESKA